MPSANSPRLAFRNRWIRLAVALFIVLPPATLYGFAAAVVEIAIAMLKANWEYLEGNWRN